MFISDIIVNAIYINIPFCLRKCSFCHYVNNLKYSYSKVEDSYFIILLKQLEYVLKNIKNNKLSSIYFGGGTPSLLNEHQINQIKELFDNYNISSEEVSIEIYPDICNFDYDNNNFFNRFSIGVQSFDDKLLKLYNRKNYDYKIIEDIIYKIKKIIITIKLILI
ncbi:radical SAM protein [Brachyspira intermedia]|uniref:radical SAM protein n=1 Tax=Brachyspira intermedia TaxID=84377 RepID=UPI00059B1AE7|nr:radical SAM protein [Brachyspira intermedia]